MPITIAGSGTITGLSAGGLPAGSVTSATLASGAGGKILQVVQNHVSEKLYVDCATESFGSFSELNTSITPASGSKVLIQGWLNVGASAGMTVFIKLRRGSTDLSIADAAGSRRRGTASGNVISVSGSQAVPFSFLDASPGGDGSTTINYKLQWAINSGTAYLGQSSPVSIIQRAGGIQFYVMEIGA